MFCCREGTCGARHGQGLWPRTRVALAQPLARASDRLHHRHRPSGPEARRGMEGRGGGKGRRGERGEGGGRGRGEGQHKPRATVGRHFPGELGFSQLPGYDAVMATIGDRALQRLKELSPPPKHRDVAESIGMTADAFSRALNGKRQFSSIELARLADQIDADLHWLITGELDPHRVSIAARHDFNHETGQRTIPGRAGDEQTLADIALAYRQAYSEPGQLPDWPKSPASVREVLGDGFVRPFADRLEKDLGVEVVRVTELSTAYSLTIGGRAVIAVPATGSWFRENWDIAHELGHLTMGHHDDGLNPERCGPA